MLTQQRITRITFSEWQEKLAVVTTKLRAAAADDSHVRVQHQGHIIKLFVGSFRPFEALITLEWTSVGGNEFYLTPQFRIIEGDMSGNFEGLRMRTTALLFLIDLMSIARSSLAGIEVHSVPR